MINITDLKHEQALVPILRLAFRPFFLLGACFAFVAIAVWVLLLTGNIQASPLHSVVWWHSHEMLFGFASAIIAGFLLTAVQNWTGIPSIKGKPLLLLVVIWLAARVLIFSAPNIHIAFIAALDLAFLPLVGFFLAKPVIKISQYRNLIFLPILVLMTLANCLTYLPLFGFSEELATQGFESMVILVTLLVAVLGGRVVPMFTANGTGTQKVLPLAWLEKSAIASLVLIFLVFLLGLTQYTLATGILCLISATLHAYRILRWRIWVTFKVPLVWVLHFSMLFMPIGLAFIGIHFLSTALTLSTALHSLTVGLIGGMILAMMARVSLGHTGRALKVSNIMALAFIAIILAALVRTSLIIMLPQYTIQLWIVSGLLWCIAFGLFVIFYWPVLTQARIDGKPG